jgi:hypothetical protein
VSYKEAQSKLQSTVQEPIAHDSRWSPPAPGYLKVNWDAVVDWESKLMLVGLVVWEHLGKVRSALCMTHPYIIDPVTAEAFATRRGGPILQGDGLLECYLRR